MYVCAKRTDHILACVFPAENRRFEGLHRDLTVVRARAGEQAGQEDARLKNEEDERRRVEEEERDVVAIEKLARHEARPRPPRLAARPVVHSLIRAQHHGHASACTLILSVENATWARPRPMLRRVRVAQPCARPCAPQRSGPSTTSAKEQPLAAQTPS